VSTKAGYFLTLAALMALQADVHALTPPSDSDGPVKLLGCTVNAQGILEASVDNTTEHAMSCTIRCNYELGERMFSHAFTVTIPGRFNGSVGRFDTSTGRAGNYSGDILGECKASPR
jgi:hypothetical protein